MTLTVQLFGRFCAVRDLEPLPTQVPAKVQELLAYLLLNRKQSFRREALADVLWGDSAALQARKYFRQALWRLQSALGDPTHSAQRTLLVDAEWVSINPVAPIEVDVAALEVASEQCLAIAPPDLTPAMADALRQAVRVYRGDLLEGWQQEWCLYERERLRTAYLQVLDKLMGYCEARQEYDEALECGARILRYDRARERTHRNLMRLHHLAGDRAEAVRQYTRCTQALRDELAVRPSARTVALYQQIIADQLPATAQITSAHDVDRRIAAIRSLLTGFDAHVRTALAELESWQSPRQTS